MRLSALFPLAALGVALSTSEAQQPSQPATLTQAHAEAIIAGCKTHAAGKRQSHAIAVYDAGANLVAALRMDGNRAGIMAFAMSKGRAAAMWGFSTAQMAESAKQTPGFASAPDVVTVPGGVPIFSADGRTMLGAVGVSGEAPADDVSCAEAGIRASGLKVAPAG